jgi:transcriptional regulator with XRE-family HTH domain
MEAAKEGNMNKEYNNRIQAMRLARGWSLRALAEKLDLSHNTIVKWERNPDGSDGLAAKPSRANMLKLAKVFNVEPGWLMFGDEKTTSRSKSLTNKLDLLNEEEVDQIENMIDLLISARGKNENGSKV